MSATIKYKGNTIASMTTDSSKTLKTSGKYCEGDIVVENVQDGGITPSGNKAITATTSTQTGIDVTNYATVSVAPTPSEAKSVTTNGDVTPSSGKLLSKVTVNVPTGTARDSSDLTVSGATVNVPAGLYSSAASKSVASGTAGTPTASKGAVSNNSVTVTPSVTNTAGYITGGTKTGAGVKVSASELVSGNKAITPSETAQSGIDVANFKTVSVDAISSTYVGSGVTKKAAATVSPSTSEQTVCASGVYTTGAQKVAAITKNLLAQLDPDFVAANIKKDVDLFGLVGTLEAGGGGGKAYKIVSGYLYSTSTDTDGSFTLAHNLGCTTVLFMMMRPATFSLNDGQIGCVLYVNPDADESIAPEFNWETYRKKFQAIVQYDNNFFVSALTGTADNNSISFSRYKNGRFTAEVTGRYFWLAVGVEGA